MHPILGRVRSLMLYLAAWAPVAAVLVYLLASLTPLSWPKAVAAVVPLCLIYAFVCLSAWYSCRATPLATSSFTRLVTTHVAAALLISGFWLLAARLLALVLSSLAGFTGFEEEVAQGYPLLFGSGLLLYMLAVALHYILLSVEYSREAERREGEARLLARDSELKALKAQVNPHFLFNSLNSISALTSIDAAKAREMCILLADFLRNTVGLGEKAAIPLHNELSLVRAYLSVEKVRFGARFVFEESIEPAALDCMVPPLLLQPLVENAVSHGIANLTAGGLIRLDVRCPDAGSNLSILIENTFDPDMPPRRGTGTGLKNVRQRLHLRYGKGATFDARCEGDLFRVALSLPYESEHGTQDSRRHR